MPSSLIDKYPGVAKQQDNALGMPRAIRETKNNQLFEKYMNRHNRKISMDNNPHSIGNTAQQVSEVAAASGDFALPSLGSKRPPGGSLATSVPPTGSQMSGRGGGALQTNFSTRNNARKDPARASISDSDFDF